MKRRLYIPEPHPFQQRERWTGLCVRPDCGLPTEHDVHQHVMESIVLQDELNAPPDLVLDFTDPPEEDPQPIRTSNQLGLFQ